MVFIKKLKIFYIFLLFKLNSSDFQSSVISTISLPESYVSKKDPKQQTINKTEEKTPKRQIKNKIKNNNNKIILGAIGTIIIGGIIYLIKSN